MFIINSTCRKNLQFIINDITKERANPAYEMFHRNWHFIKITFQAKLTSYMVIMHIDVD